MSGLSAVANPNPQGSQGIADSNRGFAETASEPPEPAELRQIIGRALEFQGYLQRRAWGVYYLTWAVALAALFVVPGLLAGPGLSASIVESALLDAWQAVAIASVAWVTWWTVAQSARAGRLRDTVEGRTLSRRWFLQILAVTLAITALVIVVGIVSSFVGLFVLDASVGAVVVWLLVQVRPWFHPAPPEATLALSSYLVSAGGSAIVLLLTGDQLLFSTVWVLATAAWAFAGVYALYHAPEEMTRGTRI